MFEAEQVLLLLVISLTDHNEVSQVNSSRQALDHTYVALFPATGRELISTSQALLLFYTW